MRARARVCVCVCVCYLLSLLYSGKANEHRCRELDNSTSQQWPPGATNVTYNQCSVTWLNVTGELTEAPCPAGLQFAEPVERSMKSEVGNRRFIVWKQYEVFVIVLFTMCSVNSSLVELTIATE